MDKKVCSGSTVEMSAGGGGISRRRLLISGAGFSLMAAGLSALPGLAGAQDAPKGGAIRIGVSKPAGTLEPLTIADPATASIVGSFGQYLVWLDQDFNLRPMLATSWASDETGSVWTFRIREGVTFNDGRKMTARDVAYTINFHADEQNGSTALAAFKGNVGKDAAVAVDDFTVKVTLANPIGNFPYMVSCDTYNLIILPEGYRKGDFERDFVATGPWKVARSDREGITFVKRDDYWDKENPSHLDEVSYSYIDSPQARIIALLGKEVDALVTYSATDAVSLTGHDEIARFSFPTAYCHILAMGADAAPFDDKRVRQAVGLLLDRKLLVDGALAGAGSIANDSPFFPQYASSSPVKQRERDVEKAKALLAEAGYPDGVNATLTTFSSGGQEDAAQLIQAQLAEGGVNIQLNIMDEATYYGDLKRGTSPFLDSQMTMCEFASRATPNLVLNSVYTSNGVYNMMRYSNPEVDRLIAEYVAAVKIEDQRKVSRELQELLLEETPAVIPYTGFMNSAWQSHIKNFKVNPIFMLEFNKIELADM